MDLELLVDRYANGVIQFAGDVIAVEPDEGKVLLGRGIARAVRVVETATTCPPENAAIGANSQRKGRR